MKKILVTGGGGFLGKAIVKMLIGKGHKVYSFSRGQYPELKSWGVKTICGDVAIKSDLSRAFEFIGPIDAVFHVASTTSMWGKWDTFYRINVCGTKNIIDICREYGVKKLIYTSTPSVVIGKEELEGVDESVALPKKHLGFYSRSKAMAEQLVLKAHDKGNLLTCAIRPHLIFGPGDPHLVPKVIQRAKQGKLRIVGDGKNLVDVTYIDNAALAHILAYEKLSANSVVGGQTYFIGQEKPVLLWDFINEVLKRKGGPLILKKTPFWGAYLAGGLCELWHKLTRQYNSDPFMTRFIACQLGKSHYFSHHKAKRDLGFNPSVNLDSAIKSL